MDVIYVIEVIDVLGSSIKLFGQHNIKMFGQHNSIKLFQQHRFP